MEKIDTLCLVDDDGTFQYLTEKLIETTNLVNEVKIFSNGLDAINYLKSMQTTPEALPEVILLDLAMPIMDGWGFLEEYISLKPKLGKKITIYILSSSINPNDIEKAKAISEVTDFIIKPITKEKFLEMVKSL